jgi:hypothetical protein
MITAGAQGRASGAGGEEMEDREEMEEESTSNVPMIAADGTFIPGTAEMNEPSGLSGNWGKTAFRLIEILPMYFDTSLKTERVFGNIQSGTLSRNGNFFVFKK